jgi:uncharacterized protein (DUF885 family)
MRARSLGLATPASILAAFLALFISFAAHAAGDPQESRVLHALLDRQWEDASKRFPEWSTTRGDYRYNDRLTDASAEAVAAYDAQVHRWLNEAKAIHRERLESTDRVSLDLFIGELERHVQREAFPGYRSLRLGALGGLQSDLAELMLVSPVDTREHVDQLLRRLAAYPAYMDQQIDAMRRGMALGWVPSQAVLARVIAQIDEELPADVRRGPYYVPFRNLGADIAAGERTALQEAGAAAIERHIVPAMRKLRAFVADEYMKKAPANGAFQGYPDGARVYEMVVRHQTTTSLAPAQIHAIGVRELASIRAEMEGIMRGTQFKGDFAQFIAYLNTDPKFFHSGPDALLAGYRDIAKRIDAELPRLFAELPRVPYGVRAMPSYQGPDAAEYYDSPPSDGSRAGFFTANALGWKSHPIWRMATLTAHEAVPGHHLQIARGLELRGLPQFRRNGGYVAYIEGWGVYAETLGREIGLYNHPYSLFGHQQWRAFRAARLVVDTGIHSMGWSRQQAIDFMVERTGMDRGFVTAEVDRYTSGPGQALGYMIGALKIAELRERAKAQLGSRFDVRRFHNAVLDQGALPLDVLERIIDEWIAAERAAPPAPG